MKKIFLCALLFGAITSMQSQKIDLGIKGGLNYNSNGNVVDNAGAIIENPEANAGFHVGFFAKTKGRIYVRPELVYTHTKSDYADKAFKMDKIDAPILLGFKVIGPLHFVIGPSFQYIINTDLEDFNIGNVEKDFTVGGVVGIGVQLGKLGVDVRYERGFTSNEAEFIGIGESGRIDTRPKQLIASVSFRLN